MVRAGTAMSFTGYAFSGRIYAPLLSATRATDAMVEGTRDLIIAMDGDVRVV